jgi:hypothetical protein
MASIHEIAHFASNVCYFDYPSKGNCASTEAYTSFRTQTEYKQTNSIQNYAHEGIMMTTNAYISATDV